MAIHVQINNAKVADDKLSLCIDTTNDSYPGQTLRFDANYAMTMSAPQIKTAINAAITLLWTAMSNPNWKV